MSDIGKLQRPEASAAMDASELAGHEGAGAALEDPAAARERASGELKYRASGGASGVAPMQRLMDERRAMGGRLAARVQRKGDGAAAGNVAIPESGGAKLPGAVRAKMEPKLGADLSDVNVHTGGESAQAASGLGARAFTVGNDVHFNAGEFAPGSKEGDRLLAHELTHVVQGKKSGVQRKADEHGGGAGGGAGGGEHGAEVSHPGEPAEKEADAVADGVADQLHGGDKKGGAGAKGKDKEKDKDKNKNADGAHGGADHGGPEQAGGDHGAAGGAGAAPHEASHVPQQGSAHAGGAGPAEKPAPISAKFIGVGRKIYRNPTPGAAAAPAAGAPAAPAAGPAPPLTAQTPEQTLASTEFKTFNDRYNALMASMQMPADAAAAQKIWLDMVRTLQATDAAYKAAPTAPNSPRKDMSVDAFKSIMKQFEPITNAMAPMMEKFTKGKKIWAFWSGNCACDIAKANSEVSLEKSALGGLFDNININGGWDIQMWASLSKAYATHAAKDAEQKTYRGFVGKGASQEQSIFNKVEQPQFMGMLDQKAQASLKITWYACAADPKDAKQRTIDPTCNVGGMPGVMGSSSDRGAMVAMAETVNDKRAQVYAKTQKVVAPDQADAALAEAEKADAAKAKAGDAGASAAAPPSGGKPVAGDPKPVTGSSASASNAGGGSAPAAPAGGPKKS